MTVGGIGSCGMECGRRSGSRAGKRAKRASARAPLLSRTPDEEASLHVHGHHPSPIRMRSVRRAKEMLVYATGSLCKVR